MKNATTNPEHSANNALTNLKSQDVSKLFGLPEHWKSTPIESEGLVIFKGDNMPENWSLNSVFFKGESTDRYCSEGNPFVVKDGRIYKLNSKHWAVLPITK